MEKKENTFIQEIKKFRKKDVVVYYYEPDGVKQIEGNLREIDFNHKAIVLMTDDEKILIPRYIKIHRKRTKIDTKISPTKFGG